MKILRVLLAVPAAAICAVAAIGTPSAQVSDHRAIEYPVLPEFRVPRPETHRLPNGMTLLLMEDHELPLVRIDVRIRTGSNQDPEGKTGLGDLFGQVQREGGVPGMTGDEIDDWLAMRAASIETGMSGDFGSASMSCLKEDFDEVFALFARVLREPAFAADKLELAKVQARTSIARRNDSIGGITAREFSRLIYGADSPLGRLTEYATLVAIGRDDLVAWHAKYYHPNNLLVGVVGDFDAKAMKQKFTRVFGDWPKGPAATTPDAPISPAPPGVYFIEKSDVTQANVRLGHLGIKISDPDYFAAEVMNEVLGGGFAGRLFSNVRSKKGLAYSVFGGLGSSYLRPGVFQVGLSTKSETMARAVDALKAEIRAIIAAPPGEDEMRRAKESILNSFVFNYDSPAKVLAQQITYAYYGLPADFLETYRANVEKVTAADVARVAKKHLKPDQLRLLVVGKAADFDRPLAEFGDVRAIDITIPPAPVAAPAAAPTAAAEAGAGPALVRKAARCIRGDAEHDLSSYRTLANVVVTYGGKSVAFEQSTSVKLPDKIRQLTRLPVGEQLVLIDGDSNALVTGGENRPIPPDAVRALRESVDRDLAVLADRLDAAEISSAPIEADLVENHPCERVRVSVRGAETQLCIGEDGAVWAQSYRGPHLLEGTPGEVVLVFDDYREVEGRNLPHQRRMSFDGRLLATYDLQSIEIDPRIDDAEFALSGPAGG